ncbi:MAG: DUF488 domain-containing protein [Rikenellaceae bacterium]
MIYSIGHGNKPIDKFLEELIKYRIEYLIDVRTKPFSKWNTQYNQNELTHSLKKKNITYVFMGEQLGGLPSDSSCYTDSYVDYNKIKTKDFFKNGIDRLMNAENQNLNIAIMCSESNPAECHRSKLIGEVLMENSISIQHIIDCNICKPQGLVMIEVTKGLSMVDLFGDTKEFKSKNKY